MTIHTESEITLRILLLHIYDYRKREKNEFINLFMPSLLFMRHSSFNRILDIMHNISQRCIMCLILLFSTVGAVGLCWCRCWSFIQYSRQQWSPQYSAAMCHFIYFKVSRIVICFSSRRARQATPPECARVLQRAPGACRNYLKSGKSFQLTRRHIYSARDE